MCLCGDGAGRRVSALRQEVVRPKGGGGKARRRKDAQGTVSLVLVPGVGGGGAARRRFEAERQTDVRLRGEEGTLVCVQRYTV